MATQVQWRGGSTAEHATFTGAAREVTVDTQKKTLVVHDGSTAGGVPLMKEQPPVGSAGAPTYTFSGDTNTGIYSPGADQVAISTGGSGRLFVDSNGKVSARRARSNTSGQIGFEIAPSDSTVAYGFRQDQANNSFFLDRVDNASTLLSVTSAGLVGVGNSNPGAKLDVSGDVIFNGGGTQFPIQIANAFTPSTQRADLFFSANATSNNALRVGTIASNGGVTLQGTRQNDSSQKVNLVLNPDGGSVGIGTTTVSNGVLHVKSSGISSQAGLAVEASANDSFLSITNNGSAHRLEASYNSTGSYQPISFVINGERARIDTSGRLLVGTSSGRGVGSTVQLLNQIESTSGNYPGLSIAQNGADTGAGYLHFGKTRGTSVGSNTIVQSGDRLGSIRFAGADGTDLESVGAEIEAYVDGTPGANDMPGRLVFSTTADGASSPTERMRISNDGSVTIGNNASLGYRLGLVAPSGADQSLFLSGISGASNGLQVNWINATSGLSVKFNNVTTTASAANAFLDSADGNRIYRSTSSLRYKTDIEDIEQSRTNAVLELRPIWYRSKAADDRKDWSWYGLIAEEVAKVEPRLVHWTYLDDDYDTETVNGEIKKTLKDGAEMVPDGVQYDRLTVLLLDVVKRQQQAIETLEAKVAALEAQ